MLRTASSLPLTGLLTLGSDPARFQTEPPACYRASWQLPGPDFHRQATTSLRTRRNTMALRHGVTSRSAGRTKEAHLVICWTSAVAAWRGYGQAVSSQVEAGPGGVSKRTAMSICLKPGPQGTACSRAVG